MTLFFLKRILWKTLHERRLLLKGKDENALVVLYSTSTFYYIAYVIHSNILNIVFYLFIALGLLIHSHIFLCLKKILLYCCIVFWWPLPMGLHEKAPKWNISASYRHLWKKKQQPIHRWVLSCHPQLAYSTILSLFIFSTFFFTDRLHKVLWFLFPPFPLCSQVSHLI